MVLRSRDGQRLARRFDLFVNNKCRRQHDVVSNDRFDVGNLFDVTLDPKFAYCFLDILEKSFAFRRSPDQEP